MSDLNLTRRAMLGAGAAMLLARPAEAQSVAADSMAGRGERGTLFNPGAAGRSMPRTADSGDELAIQAIEQQLKCQCGCGLDVFTCRTTDFTCQTSPAMHREVAGLYGAGSSGEDIVQQFVDRYGDQVLMAPPPEGFNLAGYLLPGILILLGAIALIFTFRRRRRKARARVTPGEAMGSPEEMARLERALAELET
ncbi:MAG: cytochrome c-type biogenesis protein CcmH [Gemmatimonadales bacterium]